MTSYNSTGIEFFNIPTFTFASSATLHNVKVAYRSINPTSTHGTILIPTCMGGRINTTLTFTNGPSSVLSKYHIIVVALFGNGESASPSNQPSFPLAGQLQYSDCVRAQHLLLTTHLHITSLLAIIGFSMGAQTSYHWAVMYPGFSSHVVAICGSARTSPHNYAFLEGPIAALSNSGDYLAWKEKKRHADTDGESGNHNIQEVVPEAGLKAWGRAYAAWLTSHHWFRQRCWGKPRDDKEGKGVGTGLDFDSVEDWLQAREAGFLSWDADNLLTLARMWQCGDISAVVPGKEKVRELGGRYPALTDNQNGDDGDEAFQQALGSIAAKFLLMPCRTDQYFPPEDSEIELKYLKQGKLEVIESIWGHVAGGGMNPTDVEWMGERIAKFLEE